MVNNGKNLVNIKAVCSVRSKLRDLQLTQFYGHVMIRFVMTTNLSQLMIA